MRGYHCTVLEAWRRAGGRNRTARQADEPYGLDARGELTRTHRCDFDEGPLPQPRPGPHPRNAPGSLAT
ncbi:hypothetical protein LE181_04305 [Streptomyces sp. SCA3-4]|uniref:hypothetical protein n=1 Tax=Streptomyces sichuanensis TaxID=2871810 RepID=UPI001CE25494|nr:hypothetical protein [Streptomyces sichuanensis]MCA6091394.1 hypothetical protein [Streptomyces sichuanensis]